MSKPPEGIRVIELSTFIAVPACARFFADNGADVIKIEAAGGDAVRWNGTSEGRPDDPADGQAQDEEDREFALGHVLHERIGAQGDRGKAHGVEQHPGILLPKTPFEKSPGQGPDDDAGRIDDRSQHIRLQR